MRVTSIGGQSVPRIPGASFSTPDVTVNAPTAIQVNIEARDIPAGTIVKLHVFSENGADQIADSSPLVAGAGGVLTATADVTLPAGASRIFPRATWQ